MIKKSCRTREACNFLGPTAFSNKIQQLNLDYNCGNIIVSALCQSHPQ